MRGLRARLVAVVPVLAVLGTVAFASAASLPVNPGVMTVASVTRPCGEGATATAPSDSGPTFSAVSLTVPVDCVNRSVQVTLVAGGSVYSSAPTVMNAPTQDVSIPVYTATSDMTASATVDGWDLPTTWSYAPAISCRVISGPAGATCTATVVRRGGLLGLTYYDVTVSSTSPSWVTWEVTLNLTHSFYEPRPTVLGNPLLTFDDGNPERASCGSGSLSLRGPGTSTGNNFRNVRSGSDRTFSLVEDVAVTGNLLQGCPW